MQTLLLADNLMHDVIAGEKTSTIRKGARKICVGELTLQATNETHPDILVWVNQVHFFSCLTVPDWCLESAGYNTAGDLFLTLREFYPDLEFNDTLTFIFWDDSIC